MHAYIISLESCKRTEADV